MCAAVIRAAVPCQATDLQRINAADLKPAGHGWVILDARPVSRWEKGHIPGALSFSWETYTRTDADGVSYRIMPTKILADTLGTMGITRQTPVAVYGDADSSWGGEGWVCWIFSLLGHQGPIGLVDGGVQSWRQLDYPMKTGKFAFPETKNSERQTRYVPEFQPGLIITAHAIWKKEKSGGQRQLVDTRSTREWIFGHLPGAVHISWEDFFSGRLNSPLDRDALIHLLEKNGIDPARPVVYYCTGGIRSGYAWTVHALSGLSPAINFEGGTEEWNRKIH